MLTFRFFQYLSDYGHPSSDAVCQELPADLMPFRDAIIRQAGLDPARTELVGLLIHRWGNHPAKAIILAPDLKFAVGSRFALSNQAVV